jgi:hypothetical protein
LGEARALGTTAASSAEIVKREPKAGKEPYSEQALARAQAQAVDPVVVTPAVARVEPRPEVKPDLKPEAGEAVPGSEEIAWIWPASGKLVGTFSDGGNKGIDISGKAGEAVLAAGGGKVVYSGTGLRGYGKLVIVKHNNAYLTAYAHNRNVLVKEGESVGKGAEDCRDGQYRRRSGQAALRDPASGQAGRSTEASAAALTAMSSAFDPDADPSKRIPKRTRFHQTRIRHQLRVRSRKPPQRNPSGQRTAICSTTSPSTISTRSAPSRFFQRPRRRAGHGGLARGVPRPGRR